MKYLTAVCLIFTAVLSFANSEYNELNLEQLKERAKSVTIATYPNSDTVTIGDMSFTRYNPDGTHRQWRETYLKILTERGLQDAKSIEQIYDVRFSKPKMLKVEILHANGTKSIVDIEKNITEATENSSMAMNIFEPNRKKMSVNIPKIGVGDILHWLVLEDTFKVRIPNFFGDFVLMEYDSPVLYSEYQISAPAEMPLVHKELRDEIPGTVTFSQNVQADGRINYRWITRNVPQAFAEPEMEPLYTQCQRLLVSTAKSWRDVSRWYWNLSKPHFETTPAIKEKTAELISGKSSRMEKILAIFRFVSQDIRYMGITMEDEAPGYEPHDVAITFDNRYGVCRDKAALLTAMLREADIEAFPVLIHAGAKLDQVVPLPFFNHAVTAAIDDNGKYILMDSTDESTRDIFPAYLSNRSYLVATPEGDDLTVSSEQPAEQNGLVITTSGKINESKALSLTVQMNFNGMNDNVYRDLFIRSQPTEQVKILNGIVAKILPGATISDLKVLPENPQDITKPLIVTMQIDAPGFAASDATGNTILRLPYFSQVFGYSNFAVRDVSLQKRRYSLRIDATCQTRETISIDGFSSVGKPISLPKNCKIEADGMRYDRTAKMEGNDKLTGFRLAEFSKTVFSTNDYVNLRSMMAKIELDNSRKAVFTSDVNAEADLIHKEISSNLTIVSPYECIVTNSSVKQILSYAGKKDNSEIEVSYNSSNETYKVVTAEVTQPDGSVKTATGKELSLMDANWVATAARYPAEKLHVTSLPGVDRGSTIKFVTEQTQKETSGISFFYPFGSNNPITKQQLTVTVPLQYIPRMQLVVTPGNGLITLQSNVVTNGENVVYTWTAENALPVPRDESKPPAFYYLPQVCINFGDVAEYAKTIQNAVKDASNPTRELKKKTREIIKNSKTDSDKLIAIRDYVARNIRTAGTSFTNLPFLTVTPAERTLTDGYGNKLDQAVLLLSLCRIAGFDADLILASSEKPETEEYSTIKGINTPEKYAIPLVRANGIILNDTGIYDRLGTTPHENCYVLEPDGSRGIIRLPKELQTKRNDETTVNIEPNGDAIFTFNTEYFGSAFGSFKKSFSELQPEARNRRIQSMASGISKSAEAYSEFITNYNSYPAKSHLAIYAKNFADIEENVMIIPVLGLSGNLYNTRKPTRTTPYASAAYDELTDKITINLPKGTKKIIAKPEPFTWQLPGNTGSLTLTCETSYNPFSDIHSLTYTKTLIRKPNVIGAEIYPALREINRKLNHASLTTIVIEK